MKHTLHGVAGELSPSEIADERRSREVLNGIRGASKGLWGASEQMLETANRRLLTQSQVFRTLARSVLSRNQFLLHEPPFPVVGLRVPL